MSEYQGENCDGTLTKEVLDRAISRESTLRGTLPLYRTRELSQTGWSGAAGRAAPVRVGVRSGAMT